MLATKAPSATVTEKSATEKSAAAMSPSMLDFRFADEEDVGDIAALVNKEYELEQGEDGLAFVKPGTTRIRTEDVQQAFSMRSCRWLVMETPRPEEALVAAMLLEVGEGGKAAIHFMAVAGASQGQGVGSALLRKAEGIAISLRCRFMSAQVPQWRSDVLGWLQKRGYRETGGGLMDAPYLTRSTVYTIQTRDLLADKSVKEDFGPGSVRYVAAAAAAAAAADAAAAAAATATADADVPPPIAASHGGVAAALGNGGTGGSSSSMPAISNVLAGLLLRDLDSRGDGDVAAAASTAGVQTLNLSDALSTMGKLEPPAAPTSTSSGASGGAAQPSAAQSETEADSEGESMEGLLASLMRSLHTKEGREDFSKMIREDQQLPPPPA